jgi:hypothetical protein
LDEETYQVLQEFLQSERILKQEIKKMTYIAEKVGDAYAITKQEGYSSAEAYKFAKREAIKPANKKIISNLCFRCKSAILLI